MVMTAEPNESGAVIDAKMGWCAYCGLAIVGIVSVVGDAPWWHARTGSTACG